MHALAALQALLLTANQVALQAGAESMRQQRSAGRHKGA